MYKAPRNYLRTALFLSRRIYPLKKGVEVYLTSFFYNKREREREREFEFTQEFGVKMPLGAFVVIMTIYRFWDFFSRGE